MAKRIWKMLPVKLALLLVALRVCVQCHENEQHIESIDNQALSQIIANLKEYVSEPSVLQSQKSNENSSQKNYTMVSTSLGGIVGLIENGYRSFKGIPFAQPPINNLRWEAPVSPNGNI